MRCAPPRRADATLSFPVKEVRLSSVAELNESFWVDRTEPTCREVALHARLIAETDLAHPIILPAEGRMMDGMHKVCKALLETGPQFPQVQFAQNPESDYIDADIDTLSYDEP